MEGVFTYNKYVTGKNNIGRTAETRALTSLLVNGENVVIYSGPKTGKMSLIQGALMNLRNIDPNFVVATLNMSNIRNDDDFICRFGSEVLRHLGHTNCDFDSLVTELLPDSAFVFDPLQYSRNGDILSLRNALSESDVESVLHLPYTASALCGKRIFVLLLEFQNIVLLDNGEKYLKMHERILKELPDELKMKASYIFSGSMINAMHEIFGVKKYYYRCVERIDIKPIDTRLITDHIQRNLLSGGKVIDNESLIYIVSKVFQNNIFHINHFFTICDTFSRGYITEPTIQSSLECIIAIHESEYKSIMNDLTNYQLRLLKAILDGHIHLTNSEVIEEYRLNSSANVRRLKDALCKKEIIFFNEKNEPILIDSLFEYWLRKFFFELKVL